MKKNEEPFKISDLFSQTRILMPSSILAKPLALILLGPPGTGKGTQAKLLSDVLHLPHISTGDLLREHIRKRTELGKSAKNDLDSGRLVPDELVLKMLFDRVTKSDCNKGYILDGFPRTIPQAEAFQSFLEKTYSSLIINLSLPDSVIIERLSKRIVCQKCGAPYHLIHSPSKVKGTCDKCHGTLVHRPDDTEEVIRKRLQIYQTQTAPLIAFYTKQNLIHSIDCATSKEYIFEQLMALIKTWSM